VIRVSTLSDVVAFVLLGVYLASIIFTFITHRDVFNTKIEETATRATDDVKLQEFVTDEEKIIHYIGLKYGINYCIR
jgi:Ca2+/H+ antiporter